jgi:hypothetical protein
MGLVKNIVPFLLVGGLSIGIYGGRIDNGSEARADSNNSRLFVQRVSKKERDEERILKTAEKYHEASNFEDAREWYSMIIRDFPNSDLADDAAFRNVAIDLAIVIYNIAMMNDQLEKASGFVKESSRYYSSLKYDIMGRAVPHLESTLEHVEKIENGLEILVEDYDLFMERYANGRFDFWRIPESSFMNKNVDEDNIEKVGLAFAYNTILDNIKGADGGLNIPALMVQVGEKCYIYSAKTSGKGEAILNAVLEMTENDPYSEERYKAQNILEMEGVYLQYGYIRSSLRNIKILSISRGR